MNEKNNLFNATFDKSHLSADTDMKDVLIVDDSPNILLLLEQILSRYKDFNVIEAENGAQALKVVNKRNIRLVIVDYHMPVMDGIEFIKQVRSLKEYKRLPIIMLTAEKGQKKELESYYYGADFYMNKPFDSKELIKIIDTFRYSRIK